MYILFYLYSIILMVYGTAISCAVRQYASFPVSVPVANVVKEPGVIYTCTAPVLSKDVPKLAAQVLYNEIVHVMEQRDGWYYVQVPHITYLLDDTRFCVEGWIRAEEVSAVQSLRCEHGAMVVCVVPWTAVYIRSADGLSYTHRCAISFGTRLIDLGAEGFWHKVRLLNDVEGYVPTSAIRQYTHHKRGTDFLRHDMVRYARSLLGAPYCFVGCSAYNPCYDVLTGFDCSGLVFRLHDVFGIAVPRNSLSQYKVARSINPGNMRAGDLVFLARAMEMDGKPTIYHVMIYSGEGTLIEATARRPDGIIEPQPLREIPVAVRLGRPLKELQQGDQYREDYIYCASLLPN